VLELFHAAPSYYSMVARLALTEAGVPWTSRLLDIHLAKQQLSDAYRRLNPQMTVPTLRGPDLLLTDSSEILRYAASQVGDGWLDADPRVSPAIREAVAGHYAISIETLTFSKLLVDRPWMQPVVVRVLTGLSRSLEARAEQASDGGAALRAKAQQNRDRLTTFTSAAPEQTLTEMRVQVRHYLASLPAVGNQAGVFGDRLSSADIVLAVLLGRLAMVGETPLVERADLIAWWQRFQQRPGFLAADIWTRFQRRRFAGAILAARHTPILS
jgi:glutathione S-transferase